MGAWKQRYSAFGVIDIKRLDVKYSGLTWSEIAFDVCSGGGGSDAGVPLALSARKGTRLVYFSIYASRVTVDRGGVVYRQSAYCAIKKWICKSRKANRHPSNHAKIRDNLKAALNWTRESNSIYDAVIFFIKQDETLCEEKDRPTKVKTLTLTEDGARAFITLDGVFLSGRDIVPVNISRASHNDVRIRSKNSTWNQLSPYCFPVRWRPGEEKSFCWSSRKWNAPRGTQKSSFRFQGRFWNVKKIQDGSKRKRNHKKPVVLMFEK